MKYIINKILNVNFYQEKLQYQSFCDIIFCIDYTKNITIKLN